MHAPAFNTSDYTHVALTNLPPDKMRHEDHRCKSGNDVCRLNDARTSSKALTEFKRGDIWHTQAYWSCSTRPLGVKRIPIYCVRVYIYCFVEYCTVSMCNSVPVRHLSTCIRFVGDGVLVKFTDKYHTQTHTAVSWSILRK